eukprot:11980565-Alexandrium_andersonii.AAC.1
MPSPVLDEAQREGDKGVNVVMVQGLHESARRVGPIGGLVVHRPHLGRPVLAETLGHAKPARKQDT